MLPRLFSTFMSLKAAKASIELNWCLRENTGDGMVSIVDIVVELFFLLEVPGDDMEGADLVSFALDWFLRGLTGDIMVSLTLRRKGSGEDGVEALSIVLPLTIDRGSKYAIISFL